MTRTVRAVIALLVGGILLWLANASFFYYRDNFSTHYPVQSATAELLRDGLPLWNPLVGGGQPLAGNPNNLTFYPTTLLYLFLPAHLAFNLHFILHLIAGWFGIRRLVRVHGVSETDARHVGWLYLLSGTTISCLVFYNLVVAAALMPWALAALKQLLEERRLRDGVYLGAICGLIGLAGEPTLIAGFCIVALAISVTSPSRRGVLILALAVLVALIVASPQLVAFLEIAGEMERSHYPFSADAALAASLGPDRMAEIVTGPVRGSVLDHSTAGYWANAEDRRWPPFFMSIMMSALILPALLRRDRRELVPYQASVAILLFLGLGSFNPVIRTLLEASESLRILRHPEKLALLVTILGAVLIGALLRDLGTHDFRRVAFVSVAASTILTAVVVSSSATASLPRLVFVSALQIGVVALLIASYRMPSLQRLLAPLAAVPLLIWALQIIPLDDAAYYTQPSPVAQRVGTGVIAVESEVPSWERFTSTDSYRFYAFRLNPVFGVRYAIPYALSRSPEGMHSYLSRLAAERYESVAANLAVRYLRIHGASYTVRSSPLTDPYVRLAAQWSNWPIPVLLYRVEDPRPLLWEPAVAIPAATASTAVSIIESGSFDPSRDTVVPGWVDTTRPLPHASRIRLVSRTSQRIRFEIEAEDDTILVVNQSWFPAWTARAGDDELTTFPADIDRLGILVPKGVTKVALEFGRHRLQIAFALAAAAATLLYALGLAIVSSRRIADPAR